MPRRRAGAASIALGALLATACQALAQGGGAPTWKGGYRYAFDGGKTAGGSPIAVTYELAVVPGAGRGGCLLSSKGFQSDERIVCHTSGDAGTLAVTFHGYEDGRTVSRYGVARYKPGETLLTLKRPDGGDKILTEWGAFRPDLPSEAGNPGVYFEPAK